MADEYISKRAFNDSIREAVRKYPNTFYNGLEVARQIAHDMEAADVAPVRHGRWRLVEQERPPCRFYVCDKCAFESLTGYCYCPNCGARMDGDIGG